MKLISLCDINEINFLLIMKLINELIFKRWNGWRKVTEYDVDDLGTTGQTRSKRFARTTIHK